MNRIEVLERIEMHLEKDQDLFYDDDKFSEDLRKAVRKEIAEECQKDIELIIIGISDKVPTLALSIAYDKIIEIIRGEK